MKTECYACDQDPIAQFILSPRTPSIYMNIGDRCGFASTSYDPDNSGGGSGIVSFRWYINENLVGTGTELLYTFTTAGVYQIYLKVQDDDNTDPDNEYFWFCSEVLTVYVSEVDTPFWIYMDYDWYDSGYGSSDSVAIPLNQPFDIYACGNPLSYYNEVFFPPDSPTWSIISGPSSPSYSLLTSEYCDESGGKDVMSFYEGINVPGQYIVHAQAGGQYPGQYLYINVVQPYLGIDVDGDSDIDSSDNSGKNFPGGYVVANGERLYLDVDLTPLSLIHGGVRIEVTEGLSKAALYAMPTGGEMLDWNGYCAWDLEDTTDFGEFNNICNNGLYIQGLAPSTSPQDIEITLTYYYNNGYDYIELCSDTVRLTSLELKVYFDEDKTKELMDWPEDTGQGLLRSPKYIFGEEDAIYVEVKIFGTNPASAEEFQDLVKVTSESDTTGIKLNLKERGTSTNIFDNITSVGELLYLSTASAATSSGDKIEVVDEEVLTFSIELPPGSDNYQECYSVKVDRGEYLAVAGSEKYDFSMLDCFRAHVILDMPDKLDINGSNNYKWWCNGQMDGYLNEDTLEPSEIAYETSKIAAINAGGIDPASCSDLIDYSGHGGGMGSLNIASDDNTEILWWPSDHRTSVDWSEDVEYVLLAACDSIAWLTDINGEIQEYWIGNPLSSPNPDRYFSYGIHAVLGYCDTVIELVYKGDVGNFLSNINDGLRISDAWKQACLSGLNSAYAVVVRESNLNDYVAPLSSGNQSITRDSTKLAHETTFLYYYYNGHLIYYTPPVGNNTDNLNRRYYELQTKINDMIKFSDSQEVDSYEISSEGNKKSIGIERISKEQYDFIKTSDFSLTASRRFDKLSSDKHTIDVDTEKLKSIVKKSGLSIPDNYVLSSRGEMKAERFGKGPGTGEKWDEGEVFNFVKKYEGQTIFNDTCTIAVRNDEVMLYHINDHSIQKNGKRRIKMIAFNNISSDIDKKEINSTLVYEIEDESVVPVWHIGYKDFVFRYDAVTGESFNEN